MLHIQKIGCLENIELTTEFPELLLGNDCIFFLLDRATQSLTVTPFDLQTKSCYYFINNNNNIIKAGLMLNSCKKCAMVEQIGLE